MQMNLEILKTQTPTWPGRCVDMRLAKNKAALKAARSTPHVRRGAFATRSFTGVKRAWEFSNELLAAMNTDRA